LNFFFPVEQTLAVIKPGLAPEKREQIEKRIAEYGFIVAAKKTQKLSEEIAQEIYKDAANKPYFNDLVGLMTK
jgi:nucleoside diphosphate kinase